MIDYGELVVPVVQIVGALALGYLAFKTKQLETTLLHVKVQTDGLTSALVKKSEELAKTEGIKEGTVEGKQEEKDKQADIKAEVAIKLQKP